MRNDFNTLKLLRAIRVIPKNELNAQEKLILYTLLSVSRYDNDSWHSHEKLSELTGLGRTSIKKYVNSLGKKRYIIITPPAIYHRHASNHYALNVDRIMTFYVGEKGSPDDTLVEERGRQTTFKGSRNDLGRGRQTTTKKSSEVIKEEGASAPASDEAERRARYVAEMEKREPWMEELIAEANAKKAEKEKERLKNMQANKSLH